MKTLLPNRFPQACRSVCGPALAAVGALVLLAGCVAPMGARRATANTVYEQLNQSALTGPVASAETRNVLARHGLSEDFRDAPDDALARLHRIACGDPRQDTVFALAEVNYRRAEQLEASVWGNQRARAPNYHLSAAVYAYLFLAGGDGVARSQGFDRRTRDACDLYNRALAGAFADQASSVGALELVGGIRKLAPGPIQVTVHVRCPDLSPENVETYLPADRLLVHGLSVRNRTSGIGAPLVVATEGALDRHSIRWQPATAVLKVAGGVTDWSQGTMTATLELHAPGDSLDIAGSPAPLEADTTAPIAQALSSRQVWRLGRIQFLTGREVFPTGIYTMEPYRPGRIPVLFVHGTMSSPVRWAEMWNTLTADPVLRDRYTFWNFVYTSGNPLAVSADRLRDAVEELVAKLDPDGKDPALQQIVVIGHSQGGLLTRMVVTDTGDALWRLASDEDFDAFQASAEERAKIRRALFYTPLPCVKRVVFIATPHRGSYRASLLARSLARRFVELPADVLHTSAALAKLPLRYLSGREGDLALPNSIVGMSPRNPYLHALAELPFAPGVHVHSIIAIHGNDAPPDGDDGVVTYRSAHLDQTDSELIVRSKHSCQAHPATIEEVRRILVAHLTQIHRVRPADGILPGGMPGP